MRADGTPADAKALENEESYDELKRLGYVAFTRASEQLFIVVQNPDKGSTKKIKPMMEWLEYSKENKSYQLPERLIGKIGWLDGVQIADKHEIIRRQKQSTASPANTNESNIASSQPIEHLPLTEVIKQDYFQGWAKTSFTALARQLPKDKASVAVVDDRVDEGIVDTIGKGEDDEIGLFNTGIDESLTDTKKSTVLPDDLLGNLGTSDIRFTFNKGANAGTFLHYVFEHIDFSHSANSKQWCRVIDKAVYQFQLPNQFTSNYANSNHNHEADQKSKKGDDNEAEVTPHQQLKQWLEDTLSIPLTASNQPLGTIKSHQRLPEMSFNMGLGEFSIERLNQAFKTHLPNDPDKHIELTATNASHLYRYLRGEIDLVYQYDGKFYVVDYKSNFLGESLSDYSSDRLAHAMSRAGYWLQAVIYQVALHRFLKIRIHDYEGNEANYLGAVEYVFLRGIAPQDMSNTFKTGLISWNIPIKLVKALDAIFGYPHLKPKFI